ncbi:MAG: hypothetical protein HZC42_03805 [Candidatus Eisenbacteria bacterium]|nr:hypothetical protein [Candidatus Eisenbacteria bacterium]
MRTRYGADALFPAIRKHILAATVMQPERWWYASQLARHLKVSKTSLQRELVNLAQAGVLRKRTEGKQVYYQADSDCPFLPELQGLMAKTAGLVDVVREALAPAAPCIAFAFVYGSVASAREIATSDVDLMVVGEIAVADLALPLRKVRERLGREVNITAYSTEEFARKARAGHHFVRSVLNKPKLFIVGTANDVEAVVGGEAGRAQARSESGAPGTPGHRGKKPRRRAS